MGQQLPFCPLFRAGGERKKNVQGDIWKRVKFVKISYFTTIQKIVLIFRISAGISGPLHYGPYLSIIQNSHASMGDADFPPGGTNIYFVDTYYLRYYTTIPNIIFPTIFPILFLEYWHEFFFKNKYSTITPAKSPYSAAETVFFLTVQAEHMENQF